MSDATVGSSGEPAFAIMRAGASYTLSEKSICSRRLSVTVSDDTMTSYFFAFSAGMIPSRSCATHTHFTLIRLQISLVRSTSKPTISPLGAVDSNGG